MDVDWSELPPELVDLIAKKLTVYLDYIRFRAVCVKWHYYVSPRPNHLPIQLPWLMLPFGPHDETRRSFFDLSEKKFHHLNLPETRLTRCCGSSQGWLVFVELYSPRILILNPFTRIQYQLPPVTSFPNVLDFNINRFGKEYLLQDSNGPKQYTLNVNEMRDEYVKKVVLSSLPTSPENDYNVLAILNETWDLAFYKKGVEEWSIIEDATCYCEDAIYYNGAFYAVDEEGSIAICDLSGVSPMVTLITLPPILGHDILYLVDSFGELLLVARYLSRVIDREPDLYFETIDFRVFKYDSGKPEWVQMETLGDNLLFLGGNSSMCLPASDFSGCEGNCIYFTYDYYKANGRVNGHHDLGVYHLEDCSIVPLPYGDGSSQYFLPPPIGLHLIHVKLVPILVVYFHML